MEELSITRSEFVQTFLRLRNNPISFAKHAYTPTILNDTSPIKLLKCSRQVAKSTIISFEQTSDSALGMVDAMRSLYVSPSNVQTKNYSIEKLNPLMHASPLFAAAYMGSKLKDDVFTKELRNGALIFLRSAYWTADRLRGIPADKLFLDEIQDLISSLVPVIQSCLDASPLAHTIMAGTPKAPENYIEQMWQRSTQTEWEVPCFAHSPIYWNRLDVGLKNIGKEGLICAKCGKPIDPALGIWVDAFPNALIKGYHVSQLAVSWKQDPERWKTDIILKMETWGADRFHNETLGVSYGTADQPITSTQMIAASYPSIQPRGLDMSKIWKTPPPLRSPRWFFGCDWGEGRSEATIINGKLQGSGFSVMVIGTYTAEGKFAIVFLKRFKHDERSQQFVRDFVINTIRQWNCEAGCMDAGYGSLMNADIRAAFPQKFGKFMPTYHTNQHQLIKFDPERGYILSRSEMMARLIRDITAESPNIIFPNWEEMQEFAVDFTALRAFYNEKTRRVQYEHSPTEPDDTVHAVLYAKLAADIAYGNIVPTLSTEHENNPGMLDYY